MELSVLGATEAVRDGEPVALGTRKQRALLAALALNRGAAVSTDALVELLWADGAPATVTGTLHAYVAGLRRALEPGRAARTAPTVLVTVEPGYALRLPPDAVDADQLDAAVTRARALLGRAAADLTAAPAGVPYDQVVPLLDDALRLWRGTPYLELGDAPAVTAERARLEELRLAAHELRAIARLGSGDADGALGELEQLVAAHPLRERLWAVRVLALVRSGRQADALAALRQVRGVLRDELGVDPGPELQALEAAVLRQDADVVRVPAPRRSGEDVPAFGWPMVGRDDALAALLELLDGAATGCSTSAAVVGDAGIGKSRLCAELLARARERGAQVLVGGCSQDEGAPPLWPWTGVLAGVPGAPDLSRPVEESRELLGERFRTWDAVARAVLDAAQDRLTVVVLEDLHWSDASSLRVLRHLLSTAARARLLVVATWRPRPEPTGALADVAEALARRHALRLELRGLSVQESGELLAAVAGTAPAAADVELLSRRTDGNPFFLVEYARLLEHGAPAAATGPPPAVADVLNRRLATQPDSSLTVLRAAAVLGRTFALAPLAALLDRPDDDVLDALDPPLASGLVLEDGVDRFRFAHALVRDAAYATLPLSRRARLHARAAEQLAARPPAGGTASEAARHWLAAGPSYARRAWTTAVDAAGFARRLHAHEEVRDLLLLARDAQAQDESATWTDRYDLLRALADAYRPLADWVGLSEAVDEAVAVAEAAADVERAVAAAVQPSVGALWQPRGHGVVHPPVVAALRRALDRLPAGDGASRCRAMCALAAELYYADVPREREALADEALEMARCLGDPDLLQFALQTTIVSTWRPATAERRLALADEGLELATATGDERAVATMLTFRTVALSDLGRPAQMWPALEQARELATRLRLTYLLLATACLRAPWLAMAGRDEEAERALAELQPLAEHSGLPHGEDAVIGAYVVTRTVQGRVGEVVAAMQSLAGRSDLPLDANAAVLILRAGDADGARAFLTDHPIDLEADLWLSLLTWGNAAETAAGLGLPELGAAAYARLAPFRGRMCIAGSGAPIGPVDAFLALGAVATGERETARRHADDAARLCEEWEIPRVAQWWRDARDVHGI